MLKSLLLLNEWAVLRGKRFFMCKKRTSIFFFLITDGWYFDTEISISGWLSENLLSKSAMFAVEPQIRALMCLEKDYLSKK